MIWRGLREFRTKLWARIEKNADTTMERTMIIKYFIKGYDVQKLSMEKRDEQDK